MDPILNQRMQEENAVANGKIISNRYCDLHLDKKCLDFKQGYYLNES